MASSDILNNSIINQFIKNSLFTHRQISIIYKISNNEERYKEISSGAYYRQVKQSKSKLIRTLYSLILLNQLEIINDEEFTILNNISKNIRPLISGHNKYHEKDLDNVMEIIEDLINRIVIK